MKKNNALKNSWFTVLIMAGLILQACLASIIRAEGGSWRGGAGRRAALGGVTIVLPDASSVIDLYSEGFASSLVNRDRIVLINTAWEAMPRGFEGKNGVFSESLRDHPLSLSGENDGSYGFTYFFDRNNAAQFKPYLMLNEGVYSGQGSFLDDSTEENYLKNLYGADIVFSGRINDSFSGGASLRMAFYRDETHKERYAYVNHEDVRINSSDKFLYSKAEYSISGTFAPDDKASAAVSFGTLKPLSPYYETWITSVNSGILKDAVPAYQALFCGYSYTRAEKEQTFAALWESGTTADEKMGVSGYDVNAGCEVKGMGQSVFTVSAGLTFSMAGNYSILSATSIDMYYGQDSEFTGAAEYKKIQDGFSHHVALKGRYDFGCVIAGGRFAYTSASADFYGSFGQAAGVESQVFDAAFGAAMLPEKFIIPIEVFAESFFQREHGGGGTKDSNYSLLSTGIKAGVERNVGLNVVMRLGFDAAYGGRSSHVEKGGVTSDELLGTYSNPAYMQYGISLGAGHSADNVEINLNLRYSKTGLMPLNAGLRKYEEGAMTIQTDVKVFL